MHTFNATNIPALHSRAKGAFLDRFLEMGFLEIHQHRLVPNEDKSVRFVGSATNIFKKYIVSNTVPTPGYCLLQNCLRTRNLKTLFENGNGAEWASYFPVFGAVSPASKIHMLLDGVLGALSDIDITADRIKISVFGDDNDFLTLLYNKNYLNDFSIYVEKLDSNLPKYRHRYGLDNEGIYGRNFNIALKSLESDEFKDIGNIILIERSGIPISAEVGVGITTLLARALSLTNATEASTISTIIPFSAHLTKLLDAVSAVVAMLNAGVFPGTKGRGYLLKVYIVALCFQSKDTNLSYEEICSIAGKLEKIEFGSDTGIEEVLLHYMRKYENKISVYLN